MNPKRLTARSTCYMIIGNVILSLGTALFKRSGMGCDPFNGMNMQLAALLPLSYAVLQMIINAADPYF